MLTVGLLISDGKFRRAPELWLVLGYGLPVALGMHELMNARWPDRMPSEPFVRACALAAVLVAASVPIAAALRLLTRRSRARQV
jgi:hypothetical protein